MRGYLNVAENEREQQRLINDRKAFARSKQNANTPWPHPVKPVTLGEWNANKKFDEGVIVGQRLAREAV